MNWRVRYVHLESDVFYYYDVTCWMSHDLNGRNARRAQEEAPLKRYIDVWGGVKSCGEEGARGPRCRFINSTGIRSIRRRRRGGGRRIKYHLCWVALCCDVL